MRLLHNILGMFLVSRKLGMFGPYIPPVSNWSHSTFDMHSIQSARKRSRQRGNR